MPFLRPATPPYDALDWCRLPLGPRLRLVCQAWATQGYGAPGIVLALYGLKIGLYVAGWAFFVTFDPSLGGVDAIGRWWLEPVAFEKAILWSLLFEVLGLGCGSGPLTGRYLPPFGGALYFARPGTTKLPLFPGLPGIGGIRRNLLDVAAYLGLVALLVRALVAPHPAFEHLLPIALLVPLLGVLDRTIFLAARAEHYWVTTCCFLFGADALAGAKAVQLALWFWAGVSKLNHHFPSVVCVMHSNSPLETPERRKRLYRSYPDDLSPSGVAIRLARFGVLLELSVPIALGLGAGGPLTILGFALMALLHAFILGSVPMGVPLEWNVMVVYGACFLFGQHADVPVLGIESPLLAALLVGTCVLVPLAGNLWPARISFLLAMRYYAGNWPFSVWLFRGDAHRRLERLTKTSPWIFDQLAPLYDERTARGAFGKVIAFRAMHLHGRLLQLVLPRMVDRFEEYEYLDGEIVAGLVLGYNFGDGHLHHEALLEAVQAQCRFEPGELRCLFVEPQPMHRPTLAYRVRDAATGLREAGAYAIDELRALQPWPQDALGAPSRPPEPLAPVSADV